MGTPASKVWVKDFIKKAYMAEYIGADKAYLTWLTLGGVTESFSSLSEVLASEATVRQLMTKHASADFLVDNWSIFKTEILASETAMKWIGLRDYVCDLLMVAYEEDLLGSEYWERILKDKVPTMTSNTTPEGELSSNSEYNSTYGAWRVFDGSSVGASYWWNTYVTTGTDGSLNVFETPLYVQYKFLTPVKVNSTMVCPRWNSGSRSGIGCSKFKISGSNDGNSWTDIYEGTIANESSSEKENMFQFSNTMYFQYWRFSVMEAYWGNAIVNELQFYGRALNVSVPTMTSNTEPSGEVSASSYFYDSTRSFDPYKAFDNNLNDFWGANTVGTDTNDWIQYKFENFVNVRLISMTNRSDYVTSLPKSFDIQASNDGETFVTICNYSDLIEPTSVVTNFYNSLSEEGYKYWRIQSYGGFISSARICFAKLQFYGVDYSEDIED